MFWMRNKEKYFPIRTLIWRPATVLSKDAVDRALTIWTFTKSEDVIQDDISIKGYIWRSWPQH